MNIIWSNAFTVMGLGLLVVFTILVLLVFLLNGFSWFFIRKEKTGTLQPAPVSADKKAPLTAAEEAAVAMALHLFYEDAHDEESYVITINKDNAPYNPWSSKIYGLNNTI